MAPREEDVLSDARLGALSDNNLHLILFPTEKCNFRCLYCYEDFVSGGMPQEVKDGVNALIAARTPNLRALSISWFGGEPLLAYPTILAIQAKAHSLAKAFDVSFHGTVTTNGYMLTPARHEELSSLGVRLFQISLDGEQEYHDSTRVLASGKGTFQKIWSNLCAIRDQSTGFATCLIRLHLTRKNLNSLQQLIDLISREFCKDGRFKILIRPIDDYGGTGSANASSLLDALGRYNASQLLTFVPEDMRFSQSIEATNICYAGRSNSWIIRANGRVGKCTVALTDERNTIGSINSNGELCIDEEKWRAWINPLLINDKKGMACPWQALPSKTGSVGRTASSVPT